MPVAKEKSKISSGLNDPDSKHNLNTKTYPKMDGKMADEDQPPLLWLCEKEDAGMTVSGKEDAEKLVGTETEPGDHRTEKLEGSSGARV